LQERAFVAQFLSALPPGSCVLDLPCGAGRFVPHFQHAGAYYVGLDSSMSMIRMVGESFGQLSLSAGDALTLPFTQGAFDAIISVRLLHRIREQEVRVGMLCEMGRVAKGPILVTYYTRWNIRGIQRWLRGKFPGLDLSEIRKDAGLAGLQIDEATPLLRWTQQQWFFRMTKSAVNHTPSEQSEG
jgi:ubiquinone/menaquinone biosynthesis C-methylase UbiE